MTIEQHAARSSQRERPLMVVRGQFFVPGVLDDLEEPESQRQRREHDDYRVLQHSQPKCDAATIFVHSRLPGRPRMARLRSRNPGNPSINWNATPPMTALADGLGNHRRVGHRRQSEIQENRQS